MIRLSAIIVALTVAVLFQPSRSDACIRCRHEAKVPPACSPAAPAACAPATQLPQACAQTDSGALVRTATRQRCVQRPLRLVERTVTRTVTK